MPINRLPGVYYNEQVDYELTGEGSKIPVVIGMTGNVPGEDNTKYKVDGSQIRKYTNFDECNVAITAENPGVGVWSEGTTNQLSQFLKEFFEEAKLQYNTELGVPYIYTIDVGAGTDKNAWLKAVEIALSQLDAEIIITVGCDNITGYTIKAFLDGLYADLIEHTRDLNLKNAFTTIGYNAPANVTDAQLIALTNASTGVQYSRIGIAEPLYFGKTMARICCTPANTEPGYIQYRSVKVGEFKQRTKAEMLALQNAGIIFNRDEHVNSNVYPKLNLCLATSFAVTNNRPADALFHARFNADDLLREVFNACYPQIKANESETNIVLLQTRINKIVNDRVLAGEMVKWNDETEKGTRLIVNESDSNPYSIIITGQIQGVKCTIATEVEATLSI